MIMNQQFYAERLMVIQQKPGLKAKVGMDQANLIVFYQLAKKALFLLCRNMITDKIDRVASRSDPLDPTMV